MKQKRIERVRFYDVIELLLDQTSSGKPPSPNAGEGKSFAALIE